MRGLGNGLRVVANLGDSVHPAAALKPYARNGQTLALLYLDIIVLTDTKLILNDLRVSNKLTKK